MGSRKGLPASALTQDQPCPELILQSPQSIKIFLAPSKPAENRVQGGLLETKMPEVLPASHLLLNTHLERTLASDRPR